MYVEPLSEPIPFEMGLQMPRRVCPQAAAESSLWESPPAAGGDFPRAGPAEGMSDPGRASEAGPCAHVCGDSPQVPGGLGDRVSEGEERYRGGPDCVVESKTLRGSTCGPEV